MGVTPALRLEETRWTAASIELRSGHASDQRALVLDESGVGIPDLVIAVYHVARRDAEPLAANERVTLELAGRIGTRVGTAVTNGEGRFELSREPAEDAQRRVDLFVGAAVRETDESLIRRAARAVRTVGQAPTRSAAPA